jgi:hypothetical protein
MSRNSLALVAEVVLSVMGNRSDRRLPNLSCAWALEVVQTDVGYETLVIARMECSRPAGWSAHGPQDLRHLQQSTNSLARPERAGLLLAARRGSLD